MVTAPLCVSGTFFVATATASGPHTSLVLYDNIAYLTSALPSHLDEVKLLGRSSRVRFTSGLSVGRLVTADGTDHVLELLPGVTLSLDAYADCGFTVAAGAVLDLSAVSHHSPLSSLTVSGNVSSSRVIMAAGAALLLQSGGQLLTSTVELEARVGARFAVGSRVGEGGEGAFTLTRFVVGTKSTVTFDAEDVAMDVAEFEMKWASTLTSTSARKRVTIRAETIVLHSDATINVTGGGDSTGGGTDGGDARVGGSHGGEGGGGTGRVYGSVTSPADFGSGSGGARGGGVVTLTVSDSLTLDGRVTADGDDGGDSGGGGSGGSVLITATALAGHGLVSVAGGRGANGGGGGRLAVHLSDGLAEFRGVLLAAGGRGALTGAAGTVFKKYLELGVQRHDISVENDGLLTASRTVVPMIDDEIRLELRRGAVVEFTGVGATYRFPNIIGDFSATVVVRGGQRVEMSTSYGVQRPFALPCKVWVERDGVAALPQRLLLTDGVGGAADAPNLRLEGTVENVRQLVVGRHARVAVAEGATAEWTRVDVGNEGVLEVGLETGRRVTLAARDTIKVHYRGHLRGRNLLLTAPTLHVAFQALVEVDGQGEPGQAGGAGAGGTHGGRGGMAGDGSAVPVCDRGSMYDATLVGVRGEAGRTGTGGAGGGTLALQASILIQLDGTLSAGGKSGTGASGGGSGGAISVDSADATGTGTVSVGGGGGGGQGGGGGGGGRATFTVTRSNNFTGSFRVRGGSAAHGGAGGAGTAFVRSTVRGAPHSALHIDNEGATGLQILAPPHAGVTCLDEPAPILLQRLTLGEGVELHVGAGVPSAALHVHTLRCAPTALILVPDGTLLSANAHEAAASIACSFHVSRDAEIRLPLKVTFTGSNNVFEGGQRANGHRGYSCFFCYFFIFSGFHVDYLCMHMVGLLFVSVVPMIDDDQIDHRLVSSNDQALDNDVELSINRNCVQTHRVVYCFASTKICNQESSVQMSPCRQYQTTSTFGKFRSISLME